VGEPFMFPTTSVYAPLPKAFSIDQTSEGRACGPVVRFELALAHAAVARRATQQHDATVPIGERKPNGCTSVSAAFFVVNRGKYEATTRQATFPHTRAP
jgi:hypothetical protein